MASSDNTINILLKAQDEASAILKRAAKQIQDDTERVTNYAKQAKTQFAESSATIPQFARALGGVAQNLASIGVAFAGYQIVQQIENMTTAIFKAGGELEQTNMSYQSLLGNATEANSLFSQLTKYANSTPFTSMQIGSAAKELLAFGQTGDQTVATVKKLGDVAAAGGGDLQSMSLVTGQIFAQGSMHAQDMYQVINDGGAGLIKIMAANAGGMQKLTAEFQAGGVPASEYFKAIDQATTGGGFAFEGAQKQAGTFNGMLSTLQDSATQFGEALIGVHIDPNLGLVIDKGGLFDRAKGIVQGLTDTFNGLQGGASSVFPDLIDKVTSLWTQISDYLGPKVDALWNQLSVNLIPALKTLWQDVIVPLVPVIGRDLVGAVGGVVDVLTGFLTGVNWVVNAIDTGNPIIWGLVTVFGALAGVMAFNGIFDAITVGFTTFRLITVPSVIASFGAIGDSSLGIAAKMIVGWTIAAVKIAAQGVATAAVWIAQAAATSVAWVVTELPKIIASFALVAAKAVLHAADTALAWTLNAVRVSTVWVATEMPKLVASFLTTSASAVKEAAVTSAAWIANAAKTSFVWVTTELPKIVAGFVVTSGSAVAQAAVSSAAWVKNAVITSTAWVIEELPKIVAALAVTAGAAITQAAASSAAWVTAAVTSTASWEAFQALMAAPVIMAAIDIAAPLAALAALTAVAISAKQTIDAVTAAGNAVKQDQDIRTTGAANARKLIADSKLHPQKYLPSQISAAYDLLGQFGQGYASGGFTGRGSVNDVAGVVHKGEYVLPQSQVDQRTGQPKAGATGGVQIGEIHVHNEMDVDRMLSKIGWRLARA